MIINSKVIKALESNPELELDQYVWIYEDEPSENYYVSTARLEAMKRYNYRLDIFDKFIVEGEVSELLEKCNKENLTRSRKRD